MKEQPPPSNAGHRIEDEAADWVLRRDRGFSAEEQDEFSQWLAVDPRHGACFSRHNRNWGRFNALSELRPAQLSGPARDFLAPPSRWRARVVPFSLAAAAAIAAGLFLWRAQPARPMVPSTAGIAERTLEDGSVVDLNRGAQIAVAFTPAERRIRLVQGEANFSVAKNPNRPFIVSAGNVSVRAVGTIFNVRLGAEAVEVLVTEGRVRLDTPAAPVVSSSNSPAPSAPILVAGQRAIVSLLPAAAPPQVETLSHSETDRLLAWQPKLLDFTETPLADIVSEFNRCNTVQLVVGDPVAGRTRISASIRSSNVDGFVRMLEAGFHVRSERMGDRIVLHSAP